MRELAKRAIEYSPRVQRFAQPWVTRGLCLELATRATDEWISIARFSGLKTNDFELIPGFAKRFTLGSTRVACFAGAATSGLVSLTTSHYIYLTAALLLPHHHSHNLCLILG